MKLSERVLFSTTTLAIGGTVMTRQATSPVIKPARAVRALFLGVAATGLMLHSEAFADQRIAIQSFPPLGEAGTAVANPLPIYKLHVANGRLVNDSGQMFNSYRSQSTTPVDGSKCIISLGWNKQWAAVYTTFYVVLENDKEHILAVRSCGKSPLQLNSVNQYGNISQDNFINHAQIARINGNVNKVIAAGEMDVVNGKIVYIDTCSGHFRPNVGSFLAYASKLDGEGVLALTSPLKGIIRSGSITDRQIASNLTQMIGGDLTPKRNVRVGTSGCYSYTTVFEYSRVNGKTVLTGGLMGLNQGNVNVFQNNINAITNRNVKALDLRFNKGVFYKYAAWVTTDLHFHNNDMNFAFTDETNDTYNLSVHVFSYDHQVDFNSDKPNINKITFDWAP